MSKEYFGILPDTLSLSVKNDNLKSHVTLYLQEVGDIISLPNFRDEEIVKKTLEEIKKTQPHLLSEGGIKEQVMSILSLPPHIIDRLDTLEERKQNILGISKKYPTYKNIEQIFVEVKYAIKKMLEDQNEYAQPELLIGQLLLGKDYNHKNISISYSQFSSKYIDMDIIEAVDNNTIDFIVNAEGLFENIESSQQFDSRNINSLLELLNKGDFFDKNMIQGKKISSNELKDLFFKKYDIDNYKKIITSKRNLQLSQDYIDTIIHYAEGEMMVSDKRGDNISNIPGKEYRNRFSYSPKEPKQY